MFKDCLILSAFTAVLLLSLYPVSDRYCLVTPVYGNDLSSDTTNIRGLQWNRYVSGKYVILSIDDGQGRWLSNNIEKISAFCSERWGFEKTNLKNECRIFCVPSKVLLKDLFNLDQPKVDTKNNGLSDINVIWTFLESRNEQLLSPYITRVLFSENFVVPFWFSRSAEILSSPVNGIKKCITSGEHTFSSSFFSLSKEDYLKLSKEKKEDFDRHSVVFCLMLRKELGQKKFVSFIKSLQDNSSIENSLKLVYGYKDLKDLSEKYNKYCNDLLDKVSQGKVPDYYFLIEPFKENF